MTPGRPLIVPTPSDLRRIFDEPRQPPKALRDFMRAAAPMIDNDFITEVAASVVASIAASPPGMRIKRMDKLMGQVNFTPELAREVTRTADRVNAPPEYVEAAERMVPPLENLAGGLLETSYPFPPFRFEEPMSPEQEGAYRESMTSLGKVRKEFVHHVCFSLIVDSVSPRSQREDNIERFTKYIIDGIERFDVAASICGVTLHNPSTWQWDAADQKNLIFTMHRAEARDLQMQELILQERDISPARNVLSIIDDSIIDYCKRTIKARPSARNLTALAYWRQVLVNTPNVQS